MGSQLPELTRALHVELADSIKELRGDPQILELLAAGIASNLETLAHVVRYGIAINEISIPAAAMEYSRRLAQRGVTPNALVRAYRFGQQFVLEWAFNEISKHEPDPQVAFAAGRLFLGITFQFVDVIAEQVINEYESERVRWVANRNTVRTAMVKDLVAGESVGIASAEGALGYRLRQNHLGAVVWRSDESPSAVDFRQLEQLLVRMSESVGACGQPLFVPNDRSTGWGWIPLDRRGEPPDLDAVAAVLNRADPGLHAALGTPASGMSGFRLTHLEANRARQVAMLAQGRALRLTSFAEPGVRAATMMILDLDAARRLVETSLGALAADTEHAARLRDTLLTFLVEKCSYTATAERVTLHKNTVRYRVGRALEERGRPIDDERFDLELALVACHWLGRSVLRDKSG
jgi:DNA-binding PucR family transcriptional regulator